MTAPRAKARACTSCKHVRKEMATDYHGRTEYHYICARDQRPIAVVDFACGLWEAEE